MTIEVQCECGGSATICTEHAHHPIYRDGEILGHNVCSKCGKIVEVKISVKSTKGRGYEVN